MARSGWKAGTSPSPENKMHLQTPRLILRNFKESDLELFVAYRNDPEVARYQGWGIPYPLEKGGQFISMMKEKFTLDQGDWIQFAVALKGSDELIGDIGCYVKKDDARQTRIGYTLAARHWRQGYISEALTRLLEYLFEELEMHRIIADCDTQNTASYRTLEKLGFRREAHFIESYLINGVYGSEYHYGLLQREWRERSKGSS